MANELYFDIRLALNDSDERTVKERLNTIQREADQSAQGSTEAKAKQTKATQAQVNAEKELIKEFQRKVTLNEVQFRQGKLSQKAALQQAEAIERQAIEQGILTNETLQGVRAQKTMFLSQQRISTGFTGLSASSATANQSLMNLGRIVQDLPFGFLGISNNMDPALNSFRALKEETGSTGGALRAMLNSLKGSGGLIFALGSLLPTAVLLAQKGWNMYSKSADKAVKKTNEAVDAMLRLREFEDFDFMGRDSLQREFDFIQNKLAPQYERLKSIREDYAVALSSPGMVAIQEADELRERLKALENQFGFTFDELEEQINRLPGLNKKLVMLNFQALNDNAVMFKQTTEDLLTSFEAGLVKNTDLMRSRAGEISQMILDLQQGRTGMLDALGFAPNQVKEAIFFLKDQLDDFSDFILKKPIVPIIPPKDVIIDNFNELNMLLTDLGIQPIDVEIFGQDFEQDAKDRAAVLAKVNADAMAQKLRDLEIQRQEFKRLKSDELATARYVANQKVILERNVMGALQSLSQGFAKDNKALAIAFLAVEKGVAIAQVVINGIKEASKATATGFGYLANPATAPLAANSFAMAGKIKALTALNAAAIAAQGIGEAVNISNRGSRSGGIAGGGVGQQGFFTTDEPKRPSANQPIVVNMYGDLNEEILSVKVENGNRRRRSGTIFVNSTQ